MSVAEFYHTPGSSGVTGEMDGGSPCVDTGMGYDKVTFAGDDA